MFVCVYVCVCLQDAGSSQVGFLLGSCGVSLALTSEICLKGLPKTSTGEILQFKGQILDQSGGGGDLGNVANVY